MRDIPLPDTKRPNPTWAAIVLDLWRKAGYPVLIGNSAEKVHLARHLLGIDR